MLVCMGLVGSLSVCYLMLVIVFEFECVYGYGDQFCVLVGEE